MQSKILSQFIFKDMLVRYISDKHGNAVGLSILPAHLENEIVEHRTSLKGTVEADNIVGVEFPAWNIDSMVQIKCLGDDYPAYFSQGRTMRNSMSTALLRYSGQKLIESSESKKVITSFNSSAGYICEHILTHYAGRSCIEIETVVNNTADKNITLEMLASFSLGFITPFDFADAAERLIIHRIRSSWSAEGRLESRLLEDLHLERSWSGYSAVAERFGQIGSMPVRGFFPFVAVEDIQKNVIWGAQLACPASWQMEIYRRDDFVCLSGGLADRESGQWVKLIKSGQEFKTPRAILTVCQGGIDLCCQRLAASHAIHLQEKPAAENDLPVVMNEWCTSWGNPTHDNLIAIADKIKQTGIKYLVIDAGWYRKPGVESGKAHGDWVTDKEFFPQGLEATAKAISDRGLIPGLWFEMETVGPDSAAYSLVNHLLKRDGHVLNSGQRRFWDFRDPWVIEYLSEQVIGMLKKCGFGYVKIDYNETIGVGADHNDSLGEGLREHIDAVQSFFKKMQIEIPDLVIETCSSGGHRLEPSMMALSSMASFSDAHESPEIPIIAANMHRVILPRQSQIWAVLRSKDTLQRTCYSLAATFLGRMCLSGDICSLPEANGQFMKRSISFYKQVADIIKDGVSVFYGPPIKIYRHPKGWQAVMRVLPDQGRAIVIFHSFSTPISTQVLCELPIGNWRCENILSASDLTAHVNGNIVTITDAGEYDSCVLYLTIQGA